MELKQALDWADTVDETPSSRSGFDAAALKALALAVREQGRVIDVLQSKYEGEIADSLYNRYHSSIRECNAAAKKRVQEVIEEAKSK